MRVVKATLLITAALFSGTLTLNAASAADQAAPQPAPQPQAQQTMGPAAPATKQKECPGNPDPLGVSRVVEIDTTGGPGFGFQHYKNYDFLQPKEVVLTFDDARNAERVGIAGAFLLLRRRRRGTHLLRLRLRGRCWRRYWIGGGGRVQRKRAAKQRGGDQK